MAGHVQYDRRIPIASTEIEVPEGPEIRRAADRVAAAIEWRISADVFFAFDGGKQ